MSDDANYKYTVVDHATEAPISSSHTRAALPSAAATASAMPPMSASYALPSGGGATAAVMGRPEPYALTTTTTVEQTTTVVGEEDGTEGSGPMKDYKRIILTLPPEVWMKNAGSKLTVWVPKRNSRDHYVTRTFYATVYPDDEPTVVKMEIPKLRDTDVRNITNVIENFGAAALARYPDMEATALSENYLKKGKHWDFSSLGNPIIESVVWKKVANNCRHHSVGIRFNEIVDDERKTGGQEKLHKVSHIDNKGLHQDFQVIVEPALTNVMHSNEAQHRGALIINDSQQDDNPFIANSTFQQLRNLETELKAAGGLNGVAKVYLEDLHILWGLSRLPRYFPEYIESVRAQGESLGRGSTEYTTVVKTPSRVEAVMLKFAEIDEVSEMPIGKRISLIIAAVNTLFDNTNFLNTNNFFIMEMGEEGPIYRIPMLLWKILVTHYLREARQHQAFNNATALELSGTSLPAYNAKRGNASDFVEENPVVFVEFTITFYQATLGYSYCRSDFSRK